MNEHEIKLLRAVLGGYEEDGWGFWTLGKSIDIAGVGLVTVAKYEPGSADYDDGVPTVIIFQVDRNDGTLFFRKSGYRDSYDYDISWSGEFRQVKPVERVVYDYV
jgi:hypothetical protein